MLGGRAPALRSGGRRSGRGNGQREKEKDEFHRKNSMGAGSERRSIYHAVNHSLTINRAKFAQ